MTDNIDVLIQNVRDGGRTLEFYGPQRDESIFGLARAINNELPPSYVEFLRRFGGGGEDVRGAIAGIYQDTPLMEGVGSAYGETLLAREDFHLPEQYLVVFSDSDLNAIWCLDLSQRTENGECPVVTYNAEERRADRTIASTFGGFFEQYLMARIGPPGTKRMA